MRSVNLIPKSHIRLADWESPLNSRFPRVWLRCSAGLAAREGLPEDVPNELGVEDGYAHVFILERPTTIREYEPEEVEVLREHVADPKQFFAVDYTNKSLLRNVLAALLEHQGAGTIVVEDEDGNLAALEVFIKE